MFGFGFGSGSFEDRMNAFNGKARSQESAELGAKWQSLLECLIRVQQNQKRDPQEWASARNMVEKHFTDPVQIERDKALEELGLNDIEDGLNDI